MHLLHQRGELLGRDGRTGAQQRIVPIDLIDSLGDQQLRADLRIVSDEIRQERPRHQGDVGTLAHDHHQVAFM